MHNSICLDKIRMARIKLLLSHPFFGNMATRLNLVLDNNIETAATDGRNFFYNEKFIQSLNNKEMLFLFGHEVLHNVFQHHYRKGKRNHLLWNVACDYVINLILRDASIGSPPSTKKGGVLMDEAYKGLSAEEVYDILEKKCLSDEKLQELVNKLLDHHPDLIKDKTPEEIEEIKRELKENVISSSQVSVGNLPEGVERFVKQLTEPKINWRDILRQEISSVDKRDYTFFKVNKKSNYNNGFILPGNLRTNGIDIVIGMDVSGSINDDIVAEFLSEVSAIVSQFDDYNIDIWSFDTKVYNHENFRSDGSNDVLEYKPKGGGGTIFQCNWDYMKEHDIVPKIFIMFTDMQPYGSWGDPNYCETIFVSRGNKGVVAPFGLTIEMD